MHKNWNSRGKNCELQESVNQQKVECSNNDEGKSKVFQACTMVNRWTGGMENVSSSCLALVALCCADKRLFSAVALLPSFPFS